MSGRSRQSYHSPKWAQRVDEGAGVLPSEGARSTERQACHGDILGCERSKALDHREDYLSSHFSTNYCLTELSPTTVQDKAIRRVNNNNSRVIILNKPNQGHTTLAQRSEPPTELEVPPEIADRCLLHFNLHCRDALGGILAAPTICPINSRS